MARIYAFFGSHQSERIASAAERRRFFDDQVRIIEGADLSVAWVGHDEPAVDHGRVAFAKRVLAEQREVLSLSMSGEAPRMIPAKVAERSLAI